MQAKHSLEFSRAPAIWSMYPKIMVSRKPALVPEGGEVPRIEARLSRVSIDRKHLASYAEVCGAAAATIPCTLCVMPFFMSSGAEIRVE